MACSQEIADELGLWRLPRVPWHQELGLRNDMHEDMVVWTCKKWWLLNVNVCIILVYIYIHIYIYTKYQCTHNTHIHTYNHWGNDHARVMWAVDGLFAERTVQPIAIKPIWPNPECACSVGSFSIEQAQLSGIDLMGGGTISQGELVPYSTVLFANFKHQVTWHEPSSFLCLPSAYIPFFQFDNPEGVLQQHQWGYHGDTL